MVKKYFVYIMGLGYVFAGANHFWHTGFYTKLLDGLLPYGLWLVYISGVAEILCGLGLLIPATRKAAAWGTVALLIAVFPANINMVLHPAQFADVPLWVSIARLPLQLVLIWLAYIYTKN